MPSIVALLFADNYGELRAGTIEIKVEFRAKSARCRQRPSKHHCLNLRAKVTMANTAATYTWDVFSSVDGFGGYDEHGDWGGYWGKDGPEFLVRRLAQT